MPFTLLSYNIQRGGEARLSAISRTIQAHRPDAVALIEANDHTNTQRLAAELEMDAAIGEANSPHHIAWLSRSPLIDVQNHRLPVLSRTLLEAAVRWEHGVVHLFATHLAPIWEGTGTERLAEAAAVLDVLAPHIGSPILLAGDFNALHPQDGIGVPPVREGVELEQARSAPRRVIRRFLDAGLVDCFRAVHPRSRGYTYSSDGPWARIDFIFASEQIATHLDHCDVVADRDACAASDHFPVRATFS